MRAEGFAPTKYIKLGAELARNKGVDWTSRGLFFPNRKDTIEMLERLVGDLKDAQTEGQK